MCERIVSQFMMCMIIKIYLKNDFKTFYFILRYFIIQKINYIKKYLNKKKNIRELVA